MQQINETHDPALRSWVESANVPATDFPIQNLPFGVFRRRGSDEPFRGGVAIGDQIVVHANTGQRFIYEVREIHTVARDDTALLGTTETPTLSLFTCAGIWLPTTWDYTARLVVRAELVETPPA